jgi:hypothetical protein
MTARNSLVIGDPLFLVNLVGQLIKRPFLREMACRYGKLVENSENPHLRNSMLSLYLHLGVFIFCMLFAPAIMLLIPIRGVVVEHSSRIQSSDCSISSC